ncbi:predicted protein [Nematostella vectensis]|uniref:Kelch domain-containing protein 3 n=1 Tax=Nematostella vectensis TaxID=45351 RepID=A7S067_NEMVE|nr:predicted protein [Nematostella vectensis]|eukprot:XP_001634972.1 predicted protein [Nematostella vectensis]
MRWVQHVEGGPRRVNHAAVAVRERFVFSFGGYCTGEDYFSIHKLDVHVFDIVTCRWTKLQTPSEEDPCECTPYMRYGHSASIVDDTVYIFGGRSDVQGACNTLYCFDTTTLTWSRPPTKGKPPAARDGHTACVIGKKIYIFGGYEEEGECFSNTVEYLDTESLTWYRCKIKGSQSPASWRDFHTATAIGTDMYIFGGRGDMLGPFHSGQEVYTNTVSIFNTEECSWHNASPSGDVPIGRRSHSAICYDNCLYVFGGYNGRQREHYNDIYRLDTKSLVWGKVDVPGVPPCPRRRHCWCLLGSTSVIFGGTSPIAGSTTDDEFSLQDHSDLYVLDFDPTLRTLCKIAVLQHKLDIGVLPKVLRYVTVTI